MTKGDVKLNINNSFSNKENIIITNKWANNSRQEGFIQDHQGKAIFNGEKEIEFRLQ